MTVILDWDFPSTATEIGIPDSGHSEARRASAVGSLKLICVTLDSEPGEGPAYRTSAGEGPASHTAKFVTGRASVVSEIAPSNEAGEVIPRPFTKIVIIE